jgi:hypothetical protein
VIGSLGWPRRNEIALCANGICLSPPHAKPTATAWLFGNREMAASKGGCGQDCPPHRHHLQIDALNPKHGASHSTRKRFRRSRALLVPSSAQCDAIQRGSWQRSCMKTGSSASCPSWVARGIKPIEANGNARMTIYRHSRSTFDSRVLPKS